MKREERPLPAFDELFDEAADQISGRNLPVFKTGFVNRGYYTVARRYEFYVRVVRTISCSCHENLKFISSSHRVTFFLLYGD